MSGSNLPLVALPADALLSVNSSEVPMVRDALGEGMHLQPLRLDLERGEWVVLLTFEPGTETHLHYHTGPSDVYTVQGRWFYKEYPDQPQVPGSFLYEPGGSVHTFAAPADNTEDTVILVRVTGSNINFNEDGSFDSIFDAPAIRDLIDRLTAEQGLGDPRYIGGGEADFTAEAS